MSLENGVPCRCGAEVGLVKTIGQSRNNSRVRNPAPLGCVFCFLFIYFFFVLYVYIFFYLGVGALFFFSTYTPMEVVPPVGMLVCTAAYTLAADGAVLNTPKKN